MALTVSMSTDHNTGGALATISGDAGNDDLIVEIAETLGAVADARCLIVDLTQTQHLTQRHVDHLLGHTPPHVILIHPTTPAPSRRVVASLAAARAAADAEPAQHHQPHNNSKGDNECTS